MKEDCIYKAKLIALCEGLGLEGIDELLTKSPDDFKKIGWITAYVIKGPPLPIKGE